MKLPPLFYLAIVCTLAPAVVFAQAVQLPTYSNFGVNTTVSVPDRGSAYLGGVTRARTGRNEFGTPLLPFKNRSIGSEYSTSGMRVSAYIHDFEAMDEYLLSQAAGRAGSSPRPTGQLAKRGTRPEAASQLSSDPFQLRLQATRTSSAGVAVKSVAELRAANLRENQKLQEEALSWFQRGQGCEASGKTGAARVFYQMAARRATGEFRDLIAARLQSIDDTKAPKLAQNRP